MTLQDFLAPEDKESKVKSLTEKFVLQGKSIDEATAQAKMIVYKPLVLAPSIVEVSQENLKEITFYFDTQENYDLICKYFHINQAGGANTHHTGILVNLVKILVELNKNVLENERKESKLVK